MKNKIWQYYDGAVKLTDYMGSDVSVVNAARVSFNKEVTELEAADIKLINYLAVHKHMSPFRHVQFTITLQDIPEVILRQLYKHQVGIGYTSGEFREVATVWNEVSGRYVEFEDDFHEPEIFRPQHKNNKQASIAGGVVEDNTKAVEVYKASVQNSYAAYKELLSLGVCKEQARYLLPLCFKTSVIWTASLEALSHFVKLRSHEGAQVEIQLLADIVDEIIRSICPVSTAALIGTKDAK